MAEYVKIPEERLDFILAEDEKIKKIIEKSTNTIIEIDKEICEVAIIEKKDNDDPLATWRARDVVKAIGRGFEPETALELLDPNKELKIIELPEYAGKSKNRLIGIRGRIIGREGKSKQIIENTTDTHMVVYGKTVCIIGSIDRVHLAARAVDMLANGSMHGSVYKMLEQECRKINNQR
jgi:ribosomal RNA assembly protein